MTFTYGIEPKPGSVPYVKSYSDSDGNWSLKANAKADSGIYINESSGEARVEQLSVAPDGRIRRASQVTADVIGLNNDAQNMRRNWHGWSHFGLSTIRWGLSARSRWRSSESHKRNRRH